jgi:hypothetical protein
VHADNLVGHEEQDAQGGGSRLVFNSTSCGRINMKDVHIVNQGIDWEAPSNVYWKHQVARKEGVQVRGWMEVLRRARKAKHRSQSTLRALCELHALAIIVCIIAVD